VVEEGGVFGGVLSTCVEGRDFQAHDCSNCWLLHAEESKTDGGRVSKQLQKVVVSYGRVLNCQITVVSYIQCLLSSNRPRAS
jgi:hypothetical protein